MKIKEYQLNGKVIKESKLHAEIDASGGVSNFQGIVNASGIISLLGDSFINESAVDTIIDNHEALTLDEYKTNRLIEIDTRTQELISYGFPYNGQMFSLSSHAQLNWIGMKTADIQDLLTFPMGITTINDQEYLILNKNDLTDFYVAGLGYKKYILDSGRQIKMSVVASTDKAGVDAIEDNR